MRSVSQSFETVLLIVVTERPQLALQVACARLGAGSQSVTDKEEEAVWT